MSIAASLDILVRANTSQATAALAKTDAQLKKTTATSTTAANSMRSKLGTAAKYAGAAVAGGLAYGLYKGVKAGIDFEKQMDSVGAVADASRKEMKALEKQALKLGQSTVYSASEVATAQGELAKGGLKASQILGGALPAALKLAAAGELELGAAAETTVNAMKLFGLAGKDTTKIADMLATAANTTTADVEDFAMALKQGGAVAKQAGYDLNDTVTVLESLADAGIKNSDAGTSMKTAFIQLLKPTEKQKTLTKALGIDFINQAGAMKNAAGISKELIAATGDMTQAERTKTFAVLAGTDGFRTLSALYDAGPAKLDKLTKANAKQGTAQEIAKKKMDNTAGSIEELSGAFETLSIKMFNSAKSPFRNFIDGATEKLKEFTAIVTSKKLTSDEKISKVMEMISSAISDALPKIVEAGAKVGMAIIKGIAGAFAEGSLLTKLFIGAAALRLFGGAGVLRALGARLAVPLMAGVTEAMMVLAAGGGLLRAGSYVAMGLLLSIAKAIPPIAATIGFANILTSVISGDMEGAAFKGGGAIAGAIAGGLVGGLPGALIGAGLGSVLGGVVGDMFDNGHALQSMQQRIRESGKAMAQALQTQADASSVLSRATGRVSRAHDNAREATRKVNRAEKELADARQRYPANSREVARAEDKVTVARAEAKVATQKLKQAERLSGVERKAYKQVTKATMLTENERIQLLKESRKRQLENLRVTQRAGGTAEELKPILEKLRRTEDDLRDAQKKRSKTVLEASQQVGPKFAKSLKTLTNAELEFGKQGKVTLREFIDPFNTKSAPKTVDSLKNLGVATDKAKNEVKKGTSVMGTSFLDFSGTVYGGMSTTKQNLNKSLGAFGADPLKFSLKDPRKVVKKQTGGVIVPGQGNGDKVPAMLEPGEVVWNKKAVAAMGGANRANSINSKIPRFATGGIIEQALGPYDMPPIAYDPNHADGNSHLHLDFFTKAQAIATGKKMQAMGWSIGEYTGNVPGFGPVTTHHDAPGHFDGTAFDANTSADETRSEVAAVVRLLGGKGGIGAAVAEKIARVILKGPDGPLKNMGQAALDKVRDAANKYIASKQPKVEGGVNYMSGGKGDVPAQMGRILLRNNLDREGAAGIIGNAYAESNWNPAAMEPGTHNGGLFGFTTPPVSLANMQAYAAKIGKPWTDVGAQVAFMLNNGFEGTVRSEVMAANSPEAAAERFMTLWERPGIPRLDVRQGAARRAFEMNSWASGGIIRKFAKGGIVHASRKIKHIKERLAQVGAILEGNMTPDQKKRAEKIHELLKDKRIPKKQREALEKELDHLRGDHNLSDGERKHYQRRRKHLNSDLDEWQDYLKRLQHKRLKKVKTAGMSGKLGKKVQRIDREVVRVQEQIELAQAAASAWNSEDSLGIKGDGVNHDGAEMSENERQEQVQLWTRDLKLLLKKRQILGPIMEHAQERLKKLPDLIKEAKKSKFKRFLVPGLEDNRKTVSQLLRDSKSDLVELEGTTGKGGSINTAKVSLNELKAPLDITASVDNSAQIEDLSALLRQANARFAVSQAQYGVFNSTPVLGAFADGGMAFRSGAYLVGERGPEVVNLNSGARVTSNEDAFGPPSLTIEELNVYSDGSVGMKIGGNEFDAAVKQVTRKQARSGGRVLPGRGGR